MVFQCSFAKGNLPSFEKVSIVPPANPGNPEILLILVQTQERAGQPRPYEEKPLLQSCPFWFRQYHCLRLPQKVVSFCLG